MMKHIAIMAVALLAATAQAHPVVFVESRALGSGIAGTLGSEMALPVLQNDIFHAPQYMPGYPTSATIWPRVIKTDCRMVGIIAHYPAIACDGYNWQPAMGRGEYLFFSPNIVEPVEPVVIEKIVTVPGPERIILKEVPVKKVRE